MPEKSWKVFERRLCRDMGVERQPVTGERNGADNQPHPLFCFQFKLRRNFPSWLFTWLTGIQVVAKKDDKIGILVLKTPRMQDVDALVLLSWGDWVALHGTHGINPVKEL